MMSRRGCCWRGLQQHVNQNKKHRNHGNQSGLDLDNAAVFGEAQAFNSVSWVRILKSACLLIGKCSWMSAWIRTPYGSARKSRHCFLSGINPSFHGTCAMFSRKVNRMKNKNAYCYFRLACRLLQPGCHHFSSLAGNIAMRHSLPPIPGNRPMKQYCKRIRAIDSDKTKRWVNECH